MKFFHRKSVELLLLFALTAIGSFFRLWQVSSLPPELHRDEASIGLNAYMIRMTRFDEHNAGPWPLILESFGDYKLPGMIYLVSIAQYVFGNSVLAVRLPTAIASILLIPIFYWLVWELFHRRTFVLIAAAVVTFSPWAIFLGRTAYEPLLGTTLFWLFLCLLLTGRRSSFFLYSSLLAYGAAIWSYNTPALLFPFIIPLVLFLYRDEYLKNKVQLLVWSIFIITISCATVYLQFPATAAKTGTTVLVSTELQALSQRWQDALFANDVSYRVRLLLTHPLLLGIHQAGVGYFQSWDMSFLLKGTVSNPWHSLGIIKVGYVSVITVITAFIGIFSFLAGRIKSKGLWLLFALLLIAPLPSALTIDTPNINRLIIFLSVLLIWSAYGWYILYQKTFHSVFFKSTLALLLCIEILFFSLFLTRYSILYASVLDPNWLPGFAKTITATKRFDDLNLVLWDTSPIAGHANLTGSYAEIALIDTYEPNKFQHSARWNEGTGLREVLYFSPHYLHAAPVTAMEWDDLRKNTGISDHSQLIVVTRNRLYATGNLVETVTSQTRDGTWYIRKIQLLNGYPTPSERSSTN